jgi:diadenosine tetraphosphate (Ap4A) HIT family hydrolase
MAVAYDSFREGHCVVYLKRHVISVSSVEPGEYVSFFDLIAKVSRALEKKYGARKTYAFTVGDSNKFQHLHFHLLPKHRNLPSWGVYAIQKMHETEPKRNPTENDQKILADELRNMINNPSP